MSASDIICPDCGMNNYSLAIDDNRYIIHAKCIKCGGYFLIYKMNKIGVEVQ